MSTYEALQSPLTPAVGIYIDGDMLHVVFEGPYPTESELPPTVEARMGAPPRTVPRRPFALHLGEWGQIRYMGRYVKPWTAFMYYEKVVCNIGLFATLSPRAFVETHPRRHFDSMPDVW